VLQLAFVAILILVLVAAVVSFVVMGLLQVRRSNVLAREAHEMQMRFDRDDPFDMPQRYGQFALMACGHSCAAHNVTHGRLAGQPVRAFDFRYEVGHGTRRMTRHYRVVVLETGLPLPPVLMWNHHDLEAPPLAAEAAGAVLDEWLCQGDEVFAAGLARAAGSFRSARPSLQVRDGVLMMMFPQQGRDRRAWKLAEAVSAVAGVVARFPAA